MSEIGDRIATTRALVRLSASELGRLAGMSAGVVGMIETGKRPEPAATTIKAIADVLGVTSDWLISGVGEVPTKESVTAAVEAARNPEPTPDDPPASSRIGPGDAANGGGE